MAKLAGGSYLALFLLAFTPLLAFSSGQGQYDSTPPAEMQGPTQLSVVLWSLRPLSSQVEGQQYYEPCDLAYLWPGLIKIK